MSFSIHVYVNDKLLLKTEVPDAIDGGVLEYMAASPATRGYSRLGSGLPFADHAQAFHNTPNSGRHLLLDGFFTVHIEKPNSFYAGMGRFLVPPTLYVRYYSRGKQIERSIRLCSAAAATRSHIGLLNWPKSRQGPSFYATHLDLPVRSQEAIMRDNAIHIKPNHPKKVAPKEFWGLRPPV
jgi:hypothetical protein